MAFEPFNQSDFRLLRNNSGKEGPRNLEAKINALRQELGEFPELSLDFFRTRIVRRPSMRGKDGLVLGRPRWEDSHWYLYDVGGDQNEVQLNIAMYPTFVRAGMAFMLGRQVQLKPPAFRVFQSFLGARPPFPFRAALRRVIQDHGLQLEIDGEVESYSSAEEIIDRLEKFDVTGPWHFLLLGKIWKPGEAAKNRAADYRKAIQPLLPFYEELILASGNYSFHEE